MSAPAQLTIATLGGKPAGSVAFEQESDGCDQKLRQEIALLRSQLADAQSDLERCRNAIGTVEAAASHDLISPLQTILAFSRLLECETGADDCRSREYLEFIRQGADRMRLLVQGLMDHTRLALRHPGVEPVDLNSAVNHAVVQLRDAVTDTGAIIDHGELPVIEGDPAMIVLLFRNLIANAIRFRSEAAPQILIEHHCDACRHQLTVTDNGIGLDMEFADAIFQPLKRLHGPTDRMGAGLGLAICREIVRLHGGTLEVVAADGAGSRFLVTLPRGFLSVTAVPD